MSDAQVPSQPTPPGSPASDVPRRKVWWKRWWVIALAVLVVLIVIGAIAGGGDDKKAETVASEAATSAVDVSGPATTPAAPTNTAGTDATPAPTTTSAPTTTTASTTTTAAPPTTVAPLPISGTGDFVQPVTIPGGGTSGIATISHTGQSNFAVTALDSGLQSLDLLVNTIGNYSGTVLIPEGTTNLEIKADGQWQGEIKPLSSARPFDGKSAGGRGDDVLIYGGPTGVAAITHNGASNFAVKSYAAGATFPDLLVNEIGNYNGSVRFPGPALVQLTADGDWTIAVG